MHLDPIRAVRVTAGCRGITNPWMTPMEMPLGQGEASVYFSGGKGELCVPSTTKDRNWYKNPQDGIKTGSRPPRLIEKDGPDGELH